MDLQYHSELRAQRCWFSVYMECDCASRGLPVCFTNPEPRLQFGISGVNCFFFFFFSSFFSEQLLFLRVCANCFLLMASQARKSGKRMLAFSPASATKDPKKGRLFAAVTSLTYENDRL